MFVTLPHPYSIPISNSPRSLNQRLLPALIRCSNVRRIHIQGFVSGVGFIYIYIYQQFVQVYANQMCSTTGTGHFANLVHKTTGSCSKPDPGSSAAEPIRVSHQGNPRFQRAMASTDDPPDGERLQQRIRAMEALLNETFCTISTLKNAYIQLQAAHVPYDAQKLQTADEAVIKEMKRLSELKRYYYAENSYVEDLALKPGRAEAGDLPTRGSAIESPKGGQSASSRKAKRHHNIVDNFVGNDAIYGKGSNPGSVGYEYSGPTVKLFEATVQRMKESLRGFTKCLILLMKSAGWDLDAAARSIEPGVRYGRHCHKKFAFRSYACLRMLEGFGNENFCSAGGLVASGLDAEDRRTQRFWQFQAMLQMEPMQLLSITPDCPFGKFCRKKFLHMVHPKMEESFFGGFEHRNLIISGGHPRSQFYGAFLQFAKCAWLVHRLAFSFHPVISIFHAKKGADFHDSYMENLNISGTGDLPVLRGRNPVGIVGFTVMPGFKFGNRVLIRSEVYQQDIVCA